ncbi:MAG TPA: NifU family protein [Myxococcaceae bacterium]|nr:NifU family protein [Myxococcaceae bacterium]
MLNIQLEWTPNPSTLKYVVDRKLLPYGALNLTSREEAAAKSPLAVKVMEVKGITAVMLGPNFVTVTKGGEGEWDEVNDAVMAALEAFDASGQPAVVEGALVRPSPEGASEQEKKIRELLETQIRPAVAMDGGDITLDRYENGIAYMHMQGSCAGCPSSQMTLKTGIESRLREIVPDLVEVVPV